MKKSLKILLPIATLSTTLIVPISAISCSKLDKSALETKIKEVKESSKESTNTEQTKLDLLAAATKAEAALANAKTQDEINKIKDTLESEVAAIKAKNGVNSEPETPQSDSKEDTLIKKLVNVFEILEDKKDEHAQKLLKKETAIFYEWKTKQLVITKKRNSRPKWDDPSTFEYAFKLKDAIDLEGTQFVSNERPTYQNSKGQTKLQQGLKYLVHVKNQTENDDNTKTVEFELEILYKIATYSNDGNHAISSDSNSSKILLSVKINKDEKISSDEDGKSAEISEETAKEINEWAKTTSNVFSLSKSINNKEDIKNKLKAKQIDLWYSYSQNKIAMVEVGKHPQWKELEEKDYLFISKDDFAWNPGGKKYQLANASDPTWVKKGKTSISSKIDYEIKEEEEGKFKVILKYKGAEFIVNQPPKIGTEVITHQEIEIA
ncbi:hypothetical protein [Metamycoplasma canadense]|uniref:Uncharacterized protein n=1 Tax=Metamycoplasma canadense TaxID=29554 RepID=A0A077L6K5_9BACT|nr:hypothetical protein [Metamycoplasma canadense]BAP39446.1 hypothetical protein MCAN360_0210 [Metamycoplasma canadense]